MATAVDISTPTPAPVNGKGMPGDPADERERFSRITREYPDEKHELSERAFLASKVHLARTHPTLDPAEREDVLSELAERLGRAALEPVQPPVPASTGVGYGVFYHTPFRTAFTQGTSLSWDVVCPNPPGGNVNTWLYVTAMNRADKGIEAFVSYNAQQAPRFHVFDWARPGAHWQTDIPWSSMGAYLRTVSAHGKNYQVLNIVNSTVQVTPGTWRNEAMLWNNTQTRYDLVYQFDYPATLADQTAGSFTGSWGPIIETFQPYYSATKPLGALAIMVASRDNAGNWGSWKLIPPTDGYIRNDNVGFSVSFLDPNYAFVVTS